MIEFFAQFMSFKDLAALDANFNVDNIANQNSTFLPLPLLLAS